MSLFTCPECGKEISTNAKKCPHCGYRLITPKKNDGKRNLIILIAITTTVAISAIIVLLISVFGLSTEEKTEVIKVVEAIEAIGEITDESEPTILVAEEMFNELSPKCQRYVKNKANLFSAREDYDRKCAEKVVVLINEIGTVTRESKNKVNKASAAYKSLESSQQEFVDNYNKLLTAKKELHTQRVEYVLSLINEIGDVSLDSESTIANVRTAYNELSQVEKEDVSNYTDLTIAESELSSLKVKACIDSINSIGNVSLDSGDVIEKARSNYNRLSAEEKDKVSVYSTLTDAESQYKTLMEAEEIRQKTLYKGQTFATDKWEVTYLHASVTDRILPNDTSGYYIYYYAQDDEIFIDVVFKIKNIDKAILGIEKLVGDCVITYDNSDIEKNYSLYVSKGDDVDRVYSWSGLDALDSTTLHVAITMPREIITNGKSVSLRIEIDGQEKIIVVR